MAPKPDTTRGGNGRAPMDGDGQLDVAAYLQQHGIAVLHDEPYRCTRGSGHRWVLERCVWNPEHADKAAWVIQWDNGAIAAGCQHNSCRGRKWEDFRDTVEPGWRDRREHRYREKGEDQRDQPERVSFDSITARELAEATFNIEYLIDRTLVAGQPCVVAGSKKSLKTSFILDMGISLAVGGHFLGKLQVNRACRVGHGDDSGNREAYLRGGRA